MMPSTSTGESVKSGGRRWISVVGERPRAQQSWPGGSCNGPDERGPSPNPSFDRKERHPSGDCRVATPAPRSTLLAEPCAHPRSLVVLEGARCATNAPASSAARAPPAPSHRVRLEPTAAAAASLPARTKPPPQPRRAGPARRAPPSGAAPRTSPPLELLRGELRRRSARADPPPMAALRAAASVRAPSGCATRAQDAWRADRMCGLDGFGPAVGPQRVCVWPFAWVRCVPQLGHLGLISSSGWSPPRVVSNRYV